MFEIFHLPSCDGRGEYDRFVKAPEGIGSDEAKRIINAEIQRANEEDERNEGQCDDGLPVEESIKASLAKKGFEFFSPTKTLCWDEVPR
jgi:hypothetical protein